MREQMRASVAVIALLLACTGCTLAPPNSTIRVAVLPGENAGALADTYRPLIALLERVTGRPVDVVQLANYQAAVEGLLAERVDVAELGPVTYLVARKAGADLRLAGIYRSGDREPFYHSIAVTRTNAPVAVTGGLGGRRVCLVDPLSTSGGLIPRAAIVSAGLAPKGAVDVAYTGGHDAAIADLQRGLCDVAFTSDEMYERVLPSRNFDLSGTQAVWQSEPIPNAPIVVRGGLPPDVRDRILAALQGDFNVNGLVALGICPNATQCRIAADPSVTGLAVTSDSVFEGVRAACRLTGYRQCS